MQTEIQILIKNYNDRTNDDRRFGDIVIEAQATWLAEHRTFLHNRGLTVAIDYYGFAISALNYKGAKLLNGQNIHLGRRNDLDTHDGFSITFSCKAQFRHYAGYKRLYDNQWQPGKQWSPIPRARGRKLTAQSLLSYIADLKAYRIHEAEVELRINRKARIAGADADAKKKAEDDLQESCENLAKLKLAGIIGLYRERGQVSGGVVTFVSTYCARFRVSFKHGEGQPLVAILFSLEFDDHSLKVESIEFDGDLDPLDALRAGQAIAKATRVAGGC